MEAAQERVQREVEKLLDSVGNGVLKKMQGDTFRCGAKCCDNLSASMAETQKCVNACEAPLNQAQNILMSQLENFQERLQRCGKDCEDKARDKFKEGMSPSEQTALKKGLEECGIKCADSHVKLLPDMAKRIKENLAKLSY